jgi:hypothetical protein
MTGVTYERWTDYQERIWELEDARALAQATGITPGQARTLLRDAGRG